MYFRLVPESLHWLVAEKKHKKSYKWVERMAGRNCTQVDINKCLEDDGGDEEKQERTKRTLFDVLRHPLLMFHGGICCFNGFVGMLVYWALSLYSTQMGTNRFDGYFYSGLIELPAGIMGPLLLFWLVWYIKCIN